MEKERYMVRVSDDLCLVGIFDLQENKYVVNESIILLDTAHLLCDLFNKVDKKDKRIKELESKLRVSNSQLRSSEFKYNELEKNYKKQEDLLSTYLKNCSELNLENQQLKKQNKKLNLEAQKYYEDAYCNNSQNEKAIEELEKVKAILVDLGQNYDLNLCGIKVYNFVDDKIKELRSEK